MKKILTLLLALIMVVSLAACSSTATDKDSSDTGKNNDEIASSDESKASAQADEPEEDTDTEVSDSDGVNYEKQGLPIPDGYPVDLVPLMDGFKIIAGAKEAKGDQQEVWVKFMVDTEIDEVSAYYEEILSKGEIENAGNMGDDLYMADAQLGDKTVNVTVTTEDMYDNYQSIVLITIKGDIGSSEDAGSGEANVDLSAANEDIADMDKLPSEYPIDLIPLYGGSKVTHGELSEYDGKEILLIQIYSKDSPEELTAFYKEVLKNAQDKQEGTISTGSYSLGGVVENYKASLLIGSLDIEGYEYETFCTIQLDIVE